MKFLIYLILLSASLAGTNQSPKIYDCFMFFNELEVLEIRLHELYDKVDKFVLVESYETHRGGPKPLYYGENKDRFKKFEDKIIHIIAPNIETSDPWVREGFQRNQIVLGLDLCNNDDIIMISDLDEIIRADFVEKIAEKLKDQPNTMVRCEQPLYRFFLNMRDYKHWVGTVSATYGLLKKTNPTRVREHRNIDDLPILTNAGWHFTYLGGSERVLEKLGAYAHSESDIFNPGETEKYTKYFCGGSCGVVNIDSTYPKFVQDNIPYYKNIGFIYE